MDIASLSKDPSALERGVWVDDLPGMGDLRVKVRGLQSDRYLAGRARKERNVPREDKERDGRLKPPAAMRIYLELLFEVILLDWDNLTNNGKPVSYDEKLAKDLCTNPAYRDFQDAVTYAANVVDNGYVDTADPETEKN